MKKFTALFLTLLILLAALPTVAFGGRFEDVTDGKWYSEGISFCAANGYMAGTSETVFDRNVTLTRAMFMTVLAKIDGADLTEYAGKSSFSDVKSDGWYTAAIEWAYQNGLASGIGNGLFGYKDPLTREQMSLVLFGYSQLVNLRAEEEAKGDLTIDLTLTADLSEYTDADNIHSWALDAMKWAVGAGLISGVGENILDPRGNCTRAQTAVIIKQFVLGHLTECEHTWIEPTCTKIGYCKRCDLKLGIEKGHSPTDSIVSPKCAECGIRCFIDDTHRLKYYVRNYGEYDEYNDTYALSVVAVSDVTALVLLDYFNEDGHVQMSGSWLSQDGYYLQTCIEIDEIASEYHFETYLCSLDGSSLLLCEGFLDPAKQTVGSVLEFSGYYGPETNRDFVSEFTNEMKDIILYTVKDVFFTNNPVDLTLSDLGFVNF